MFSSQRAPRPYPNLLLAVCDGLDEVFNQGYYADRVVSHLLKRDKRWGARDRGFIAETLYDSVRWWRLLVHIGGSGKPEAILASYWAWKYNETLDVEGYPRIEPLDVQVALKAAGDNPALLASMPDWIDEIAAGELGEEWPTMRDSLNEQASVYLRTNTLKTDRNTLLDELLKEGFDVEADPRGDLAIKVLKRRNLWKTNAFQSGHFEVQDIASQQVAPALDIQPGMTVVDACAGAGGKTLQIAALMKNKGRLIAMDTEERKLVELKKRAKRAGISNLDIRPITSTKVIKRLVGKADRILLDVPCSGLGVLRRNPDAKWKLKPQFLEEVKTWQADILSSYSRILKPDGKLVYATCSILPSESEEQVAKFIEANDGWQVDQQLRLSPVDDYDGFYHALLTKA
ncbi:MAG: RsmB/NOP family class I SAM-dependent RNA methyltransferase [Saprospiraceae bacterium]